MSNDDHQSDDSRATKSSEDKALMRELATTIHRFTNCPDGDAVNAARAVLALLPRPSAPSGETIRKAALLEAAEIADDEASPTPIEQPLTNAAYDEAARTIAANIRARARPPAPTAGGEATMEIITEFMETKGYPLVEGLSSPVSLLNELDYQARECGEAAGKVRSHALIETLKEALSSANCPRPANGAPLDLPVEECVNRRECGCNLGAALALADGGR